MLAYRADIDGLRAVAVLSVILFHANVPGLPGGYVGVDVFFVISGFLIASIIQTELDRGSFSIAKFYERRLRRIFPPLFTMLAACWAAGYFLLLPRQFAAFGKSVVAATLFAANILFYDEAGYFARASEQKPLLHTWSLCVEEQFYFVFPLLLATIHRYRRALLPYALAVLTLVSFACSQWMVRHARDAAFFLPHSRAWELLLGALLSLRVVPSLRQARLRNALSIAGIIAIVGAVTMFTARTSFPGGWALVPCLGACAVIHAGSSGPTFVGRCLGGKLPVAIGLISYGLYLWHWPLLVFARIRMVDGLTPLSAALMLALTAVVSVASFYWLEEPIRKGRVAQKQRSIFASAALVMGAAVGLGMFTVQQQGIRSRVQKRVLDLEQQSSGTSRTILNEYCRPPAQGLGYPRTACAVGDPAAVPSYLIWGDSHAASLVPGIAEASRTIGRAGLVATRPACPPLLGVRSVTDPSDHCKKYHGRTQKLLASQAVRDVFLVGRWATCVEGTRYKQELGGVRILYDNKSDRSRARTDPAAFERGLARTLAMLERRGKRAVIVADVPEVGYHTAEVSARLVWWDIPFDIRPTRTEFFARQKGVFATFDSLRLRYQFDVVYPHKILCDADHCQVQRGDRLLYKDTNHLAPLGAKLLTPMFAEAFHKSSSQ